MNAPAEAATLPETAGVYWRPRMDARRLDVQARYWALTMAGHTVPFIVVAVVLFVAEPLSFPVGLAALAHAWGIPELYAKRGANVLRPARTRGRDAAARDRAAGLLGDLVGHDARELFARTGLVTERGSLGVWLVGEAGAVLVRRRGRRAHCFCIRVDDPDLPPGDRVAHLLLALREDEAGFATVANGAFTGAPWRVRRRLPGEMRPGIDAAVALARHPTAERT